MKRNLKSVQRNRFYEQNTLPPPTVQWLCNSLIYICKYSRITPIEVENIDD